jgi:hypothetical protein
MAAQNCSDMLVKVCKQAVHLNKENSNSYWVKQNITLYLIPKIYQAPPTPQKIATNLKDNTLTPPSKF